MLYLRFGRRKLSRISVSIDFLVGKELEASGKLEVLQQDGSCSLEGLKEGADADVDMSCEELQGIAKKYGSFQLPGTDSWM